MTAIKNQLTALGLPCPILIMGGSPTFPCYAQNMDGVFFSPGTVFLYDSGYKAQFPDLPYTAGAAILTRVVSHPADGYFTLDTGLKIKPRHDCTKTAMYDKSIIDSEAHDSGTWEITARNRKLNY